MYCNEASSFVKNNTTNFSVFNEWVSEESSSASLESLAVFAFLSLVNVHG
jgi:hypothetical protein